MGFDKVTLTWRTWLLASVSLIAGCGIALLVELWWKSVIPNKVVVHHIDVTKVIDGSHVLSLSITGIPAKQCLRFTQHLIYQDQPNLPPDSNHSQPWLLRHYVPLSMAISGIGFGSISDYAVTLAVPPDVPLGKWEYLNRSVYMCTVFPGLMRYTETVNEPIEIELN